MTSPHFSNIYISLLQNKIHTEKRYAKELQHNSQNYVVLDGLLFKIISLQGMEPYPVLYFPTAKAHILLNYYHSSLFGGHSGITKCFQTISQCFHCPNLAENQWAYITGCHICQLHKKGPSFSRPFQKMIYLNLPAMTKISMDIKHIPPCRGYSFIFRVCKASAPLMYKWKCPFLFFTQLKYFKMAAPFSRKGSKYFNFLPSLIQLIL